MKHLAVQVNVMREEMGASDEVLAQSTSLREWSESGPIPHTDLEPDPVTASEARQSMQSGSHGKWSEPQCKQPDIRRSVGVRARRFASGLSRNANSRTSDKVLGSEHVASRVV